MAHASVETIDGPALTRDRARNPTTNSGVNVLSHFLFMYVWVKEGGKKGRGGGAEFVVAASDGLCTSKTNSNKKLLLLL